MLDLQGFRRISNTTKEISNFSSEQADGNGTRFYMRDFYHLREFIFKNQKFVNTYFCKTMQILLRWVVLISTKEILILHYAYKETHLNGLCIWIGVKYLWVDPIYSTLNRKSNDISKWFLKTANFISHLWSKKRHFLGVATKEENAFGQTS